MPTLKPTIAIVLTRLSPALMVVALTAPIAARPLPPSSFDGLFDEAFACRPLGGVPGDEPQRPPAIAMRHVALAPLGVTLALPKGWSPPKAAVGYVAEAQDPGERVHVRVTVETLGELDLPAAVARYEGRLLGANTASDACSGALLRRYGLAGVDAQVGVYRSAYPYRGWVTTYVLYQRRSGELVTLEVETRWTRSRPPLLETVDAILLGFSAAPAGSGAAGLNSPSVHPNPNAIARSRPHTPARAGSWQPQARAR